jgi:MFS family permease
MHQRITASLIWLVTTLFVVYAFCLNTAAAIFSETIKTTLHTSNLGVSAATGAFILGFAVMQIPAGYLLDKFNARFVVSGGVLLLAIGNVGISYSNHVAMFAIANFFQGVGASFAFVAAAVLISQWFSEKSFPILFGLTQTISCISAGFIHYFFTLSLQTHSWNEIYRLLAVFGSGLVILTLLFVKTPCDYQRNASASLFNSLTSVLKNKQLWLCSGAAALSFGVLLAYASMWFMKVQEFYHVDNLQSVIISGIIFAGIGVGTPVLGWLSNAWKSRTMVIHLSLVLGTMTLLMGLYLPHLAIDNLIIIKIVSFLIGFFLSGSMLFYTVVSEISSDSTRGLSISVLNTAVFLFNTIMLFIPYLFITTASTEFFTYLWILPFCTLLSILLLYFIKDTFTP